MAWTQWGISLLLASATAANAADTPVFSKASNDSLLWGPYRPNLYFGVRPRLAKSLMTGLLWGRVEDYTTIPNSIRYTCEQNEDMAGYGWDVYDPRTGGIQTVHDKGNGIDMEMSFVKFDKGRGGWGARIKGTPREDAEPQAGSQAGIHDMKTSVWLTASLEGLGSLEALNTDVGSEYGYEDDVIFSGQSADLGEFTLTVTDAEGNSHPTHAHRSILTKPLDKTLVHSMQVSEEILWQGKGIVFNSLKTTIDEYVEEYTKEDMPPAWQTYTIKNLPGPGNVHVVQKVFEGPFEFDVLFVPSGQKKTSKDLNKGISEVSKSFGKKYADILGPQAPFDDEEHLEFSKALFSNLIGGIGYFYGDQVIDRSYAPEYDEENEGFWEETAEARAKNQQKLEGPYELFTSVPSRPFFPRGFLWDEGFHLLPIIDWDPELVMQILTSWFNTMDEDGWIPREQILGSEARSKVPAEFQVQYPHYANPPTLFMTLEALLDKLVSSKSDETFKPWLESLYPLLVRNFEWYRRTQWGDLKSYDREAFSTKEGYRWRGRTPQHILTSGLDDYPRAQPPHPGELHTDLISWMGLMSSSLERVAAYLGDSDDEAKYAKITNAIRHNIDDLHWSKEEKAYCDATIDDYEESALICHKGYISLFPFMTGMLGPNHEHLGAVLDLIGSEDELWSPFGIRSLSLKDELYGSAENYWRSPIWMNMNYLIVKGLLNVALTPSSPQQERARTLYTGLRKNLVNTVFRSWRETGFAWEQYNPETGAGQRTQHFTGWTSLVVKIMEMPNLAKGAKENKVHDEL